MGNSIDYIRIAAIQFPFIPVIVHPGYNTLSEPDGNINFWIIGKDDQKINTNVSTLASFLKSTDIDTEILKNLQSDYIDWLVLTVEGTLRFICNRENPDIILFPEYSLPLEVSNDLRDILSKYSEKRCIIGGIGSVNHNGKQKKNRFVVINDGNIQFGEKVVPNADEKKIGIEPGNGPLLHKLTLQPNEGKEVLALITMCSDFLDLGSSPGRVSTALEQEFRENGCTHEDVDIILVPMFTTKTQDMQQIAGVEAGRKWRITALANCSFWGKTHIRFHPADIEGLEDGISSFIQQGEIACIVADIPHPAQQKIEPKSTSIGRGNGGISGPCFEHRKHYILFKEEEGENNLFKLDSEIFLTLVIGRLNNAITYASVIHLCTYEDEHSERAIKTINAWKGLQNEFIRFIPSSQPITTYKDKKLFLNRDINLISIYLRLFCIHQ
jgi:hypothetical protein